MHKLVDDNVLKKGLIFIYLFIYSFTHSFWNNDLDLTPFLSPNRLLTGHRGLKVTVLINSYAACPINQSAVV